jgi:hypothetical protein
MSYKRCVSAQFKVLVVEFVARGDAYLMWQSQGELDLVRCDVRIPSSLDRGMDGSGAHAERCPGNAKRAHGGVGNGEDAIAGCLGELCLVLKFIPKFLICQENHVNGTFEADLG